MRCTKAREVLVLEASGDASKREHQRAAAHRSGCEECRSFSAEEPLALASLRTSSPLGQADFAAIRARVLSRIAADKRPGLLLPLRWVLATTIVALLGIAALLSIHRSDVGKPSTPMISKTVAEPSSLQPMAAPNVEERAAAVTVPVLKPRRPSTRLAARAKTESTPSSIPKPQMRIQIQTADPDVRIIWIANPTQFSETTFLKEESS